ncbi:MAG: hypothetical protein ACJ768_19645 [Gaiellaceae bacterium]
MRRRLAENGLTADDERELELLDYATEGRDGVLQALAAAAPLVVQQLVTLQVDAENDRRWQLPDVTRDPLRVLCLRDASTGRELEPSSSIDNDNGDYVWRSTRLVQLAKCVTLEGSLEGDFVLHPGQITDSTDEGGIGLPTPCHRAAAKLGVVLALTADEQSDASIAAGLFQRELDVLEKLYGQFDDNGGFALRNAILQSLGNAYGDMLA